MTNSFVKKCLTSLIIREIQIKTQWDIASHLSEWLSSKRQDIANAGEEVEKKEPLYTDGGNVNWCNQYGKQYGGVSKKLKKNYHMIQQFYFWKYIQRNCNHILKRYLHLLVHCSITQNSQDTEATYMSINEWLNGWTNKENMVYMYNGMCFSLKNERNLAIWDKMVESGQGYIMLSEISYTQKEKCYVIPPWRF